MPLSISPGGDFMLKTFAVLALLVISSLADTAMAEAKTFKLGETPVAEITIPDASWTVDAAEGTVEATASDSQAYVSADIYPAADILEAGKATAHFLLEQKIKVDPKSKVQKETKVAGLPAVEIAWDATDEDGPTRFRIQFVKLKPDTLVLLTYWRSPAGETAHGAEVAAIEDSLKPIK